MRMRRHSSTIAALARAGKQAQAIERRHRRRWPRRDWAKAERMALLDQRAEALIAEGRFDDAAQ